MASVKSPIRLSRGVWILLKKELADLFFSPLLYVLAALFSFIMGWLFFNYLMQSKTATTQTLTPAVVVPLFGNMNFIFIFTNTKTFVSQSMLNQIFVLKFIF